MNQTVNQPVKKAKKTLAQRNRIALWSVFFVLATSLALPLMSYSFHWLGMSATAQEAAGVTNPRNSIWSAVREGVPGYSAVKGEGANVLVQSGGTDWLATRNGALIQKLPWIIAGMAGLILLFHLFAGRNKLDNRDNLSGRKIKRWSWIERLVHWVTAISFILLAITGISMLIGKTALIPLLGKSGFAAWAGLAISIHNYIGPLFSVGIALMILMWVWHNFPNRVDMKWLAAGGGLFKKNHPSAGRMNAGEKIWFWLLATVGVVVCITGVIMVAPLLGFQLPAGLDYTRANMQQANLIHGVLGVIWTAIALGHIYIGTAGTEGAFEGMSTGYVSEEWAHQHHDLWAAKMVAKGKVIDPAATVANRAEAATPATPTAQS